MSVAPLDYIGRIAMSDKWQCEKCGEMLDSKWVAVAGDVGIHPVSEHGCDGSDHDCENKCPVQVPCGPVRPLWSFPHVTVVGITMVNGSRRFTWREPRRCGWCKSTDHTDRDDPEGMAVCPGRRAWREVHPNDYGRLSRELSEWPTGA